jgi:DNA-binding transcriptional LysR family regulator
MHYTLHQLRIFLKVHEYQSITRAAEELHLTQPAISIQLKRLQEQFDLPLTEVIGRKLYTTAFGQEIALHAQRIIDETDSLKYTIDQYKGLVSGKLSFSVVSTGKYVIPYFLKPFMDEYPGIDISIDVSNKNRVVEGLHKNESDFSLVSLVPEGIEVETLELMENRLYLVGSEDFSSIVKKPKDLERVTLLFREEGSATRKAMEKYLEQRNIRVGKSMELVSNEAIKQAIIAGIGLSIVPLIGLRTALEHEQIKILELPGLPVVTNWNLVYNKGKKLSPAHLALLEFIEQNKKAISEKHFRWSYSEI